ncbi:hypothetical protein A2935_01235 [Candidatus Wolfebacteria bacterium RIFCSPLOWO2_01_FULL_47_17b]|uniref:PDZ domain-containing protein n=1 Tax=Candidatus Wolfebacteria bacterium RIFCSPLOWO2_01_FULL_47_17b TaxID=1802558 RepID=A0A1F8DZT7_9BACT|nr:MAG: hypothetical protein A2935_01235 [Candidatus Wolfebacteria bacterium RIFCSPLOWO2_01_FULL_47_17b]
MYHHTIKKLQKNIKRHVPATALVGAGLLIGILTGPFVFSQPVSNANILDDIQNLLQGNATVSPAPIFNGTSQEEAIIRAVESASPSVVSIVISKDVPIIERCQSDAFSDLPEEFRQFFGQRFDFSVPCETGTERREVGGGSGFIVSPQGLIATNKHVVSDAQAEYTVFTADGKKYEAQILARHPSLDVAILKVEAAHLPAVRLGDSSGLRLGQTAIALGNSLGEFNNTVSVGIVSGLARSVTASTRQGEVEMIENVIQTDAAINPGNSGGPLLNSAGEVIGINTAMVSGAENIGFAIPINAVKRSIETVSASGKILVGYLGVRYALTEEGARIEGDESGRAVEAGSPADRAGIKEGDILIAVDGQKIDAQHTPAYVISQKNPGDSVELEILRGNETIKLQAVLGERS